MSFKARVDHTPGKSCTIGGTVFFITCPRQEEQSSATKEKGEGGKSNLGGSKRRENVICVTGGRGEQARRWGTSTSNAACTRVPGCCDIKALTLLLSVPCVLLCRPCWCCCVLVAALFHTSYLEMDCWFTSCFFAFFLFLHFAKFQFYLGSNLSTRRMISATHLIQVRIVRIYQILRIILAFWSSPDQSLENTRYIRHRKSEGIYLADLRDSRRTYPSATNISVFPLFVARCVVIRCPFHSIARCRKIFPGIDDYTCTRYHTPIALFTVGGP